MCCSACWPRLAVVAVALAFVTPASAVFNKPISLKDDALREELIFVATVESVDPEKPSVVFKVDAKLKGEPTFEKLAINLTGTADAKKANHTQIMLDRLEPGRQLVAFASKRGKKLNAVAFLEGTWFSLQGTIDADGKTIRWAFLNCEPNLRGTFKGTTAELKKIIEDGLAKKADPPPPNLKEPPGYGEPIKKRCGVQEDGGVENASGGFESPVDTRGPVLHSAHRIPHAALLGVIPSFALIGPMAIIAALFPGVAARMAIGMKKWRAFLVVASANSTLAIIYFFLGKYRLLPDTPAFSLTAFTLYLMAITAVGLLWAGRRYRTLAAENPGITASPAKGELLALVGLTVFAGGIAASTRFFGPWSAAVELPLREFTFIAAGLFVATLYAAYRALSTPAEHTLEGGIPRVHLSISGESVGLGTLFLCGFSTVLLTQGGSPAPPVISVPDNGNIRLARFEVFEVPNADQVMSGLAVEGDRLYLGTSTIKISSQDGSLVCLNRNTGSIVWTFEADDDLQPVFSTPTLAGGKIFFGEGLHAHHNCRFFCLDASTGKSAWPEAITTSSHTEGTPLVRNGRVFFTAGDDGLICADATTGTRKWQAGGKEKGLHIDGPPAFGENRVFAGSGLYTSAVFALDAESGNELWRTPVSLRSFGPPLAIDNRVIYGLGTGNMTSDTFTYDEEVGKAPETDPAGAVIAVDAATGKLAWRYDLTRSVHTSLAADEVYIYAASRDGCVHCLSRKTGKLRWKMPLGITLTAGPAVATDADGFPLAVYAASTNGTVACLNPHTGRPFWVRDLREETGKIVEEIYSTPVVVTEGAKRSIYIGGMVKNLNNGTKTAAVFRFEDERTE